MRKVDTPYRVGPLYLITRGGNYYIHGTYEGRLIRIAAKTDDLRRAKLALDDLVTRMDSGFWRAEDDIDISWKKVARSVSERHRFNSRSRGIPFEITAIDVYHAMRSSDFRCALSGVPFSRRIGPSEKVPDPWSASIDRIENRHGYTKENIRVVCLAANIAMNRWGYDVLLRLARGVTRSSTVVAPENLTHQEISDLTQTAQVIDMTKRMA